MKYRGIHIIFILIVFFHPGAECQQVRLKDTVKINEVIIRRKVLPGAANIFRVQNIDSAELSLYAHCSVAESLASGSGIVVKSYGMGGIAIPSFRGTGAGNTIVSWNGINLNNPMTGQTDLSLFQSGMVDAVNVYQGSAARDLNEGICGGVINLETVPEWKETTAFDFSGSAGSFGTYSVLAKVRTGTNSFNSVTRAYAGIAENNFKYLNPYIGSEPVLEVRNNNQVEHKGIMQEFFFKKNANIFSAKLWYQNEFRNLPSSLLSTQINTGEKQFDESLRMITDYDINKGNTSVKITGGWLMNRLNYSNNLASIDSRNRTYSTIFKVQAEQKINQNWLLRYGINEEFVSVLTNNYESDRGRNKVSAFLSAESSFNRFGTVIYLTEILDRDKFMIPDFSIASKLRLSDNGNYILRAGFSKVAKIPSLNDLYWYPGGNSSLKNETAYTSELSLQTLTGLSSDFTLTGDITLFTNIISDMIVWHPGDAAFWIADNVASVASSGVQSSVKIEYEHNKLNIKLRADYSYTNAIVKNSYNPSESLTGRKLIYVPSNQLSASLFVVYGNIYASWIADATGKRFITSDNSKFLQSYFINSVSSGIRASFRNSYVVVGFGIENLFNVNYQTIAYYPLPGRSYNIKIGIHFNK